MHRIYFLLLNLMLFSAQSTAVTIEEANTAYNTIRQHIDSVGLAINLDESLLQHNIDILQATLNEFEFDDKNFAIILELQLFAANTILKKQHFSGQPYDVSQVQRLLDDLDDLIGRSKIYLGELEYTAGHIAAHQLNNFPLAHQYWLRCAEAGHAGCMNILASNYESGRFNVEQDVDKAVLWHQKVSETGTRWNCAGFYSTLRLAMLSVAGVETNTTTTLLLEQASTLRAELVEKRGKENMCGDDIEYMAHYVLDGFKQEWLEKLNGVVFDETNITLAGRKEWISNFANSSSISQLMPALYKMYDDELRCSAAEEFAMKVRTDAVQLQMVLDYIRQQDIEQCDTQEATTLRLLSQL